MNVLSLFDGISCGQIALERAEIQVDNYFASEIDKHAIKVTQHNYPDTIQLGDVTKWREWKLPRIDLLIGGSPCQGFSFAGKQLNFNDPRSKLFFEFVDVLNHYKPKHFLLENVVMKKKWKDIISEKLGVEPVLINSALVSAQNRKRLYWTNISNITQPEDKCLLLKDILENNVDRKYDITERYYRKVKGTLSYKKARTNIRTVNMKSKTLTTAGHNISNSGSTNIIIFDDDLGLFNNYLRMPTPIECERLQTIPDDYTNIDISDSKRYHMLGNGWTVDVIVHIFKFLKKGISGCITKVDDGVINIDKIFK